MMAEEKKMPIADEAEAVSETVTESVAQTASEAQAPEAVAVEAEKQDISEKLKAAAGNIRRAGADARARKSEQEKDRKQSEAEAQARLEEAEKKLKADEERARLVAEQKLAALDYAQNYRKKLQKDRQKAMSAAKAREKAEREAEEAKAREERAKEIAALLEKEREEARERGEKATELLNRVTKCAVVDENGNLRMVDKMELLKEKSENDKAAVASVEAEEPVAAAEESSPVKAVEAKPAEEKAYAPAPVAVDKVEEARREVEDFLVGEMMTVEGDRFILNVEEEDMTVSLTDKDDPSIIPANMIPEDKGEDDSSDEDKFAAALAEHEAVLSAIRESTKLARDEMKRMLDDEQDRFEKEMEALKAHRAELAEIQEQRRQSMMDEIAALAAIAAKPEPEEKPQEEPKDETASFKPVVNNDPVVLTLRKMGEEVNTKRRLKKYIRKSKKAVKKLEKNVEAYEAARQISDPERSRVALCHVMNECGKILEIRCDNLSAAARIRHDKLVKKLREMLYVQIERYNRKATEFGNETGEMLTRVSAFLPDHLTNETGKAVIPVLAYRDRYEQLTPDDPEMPKSYVVSFPSVSSLKAGESTEAVSSVIAVGGEKKTNPITTKVIVEAALLERDLLASRPEITSKKSFKKLRKLAKKAYKTLDKKAKSLGNASTPESAVSALLIERERVLVGSRVLIGAVKIDVPKYVAKARVDLEQLFGRYNNKAEACERICETPVTKIHPLTASKVAEAMLIPDMPSMVHVNELFETVGDDTRVVGDPSGKKANDPDGSFTFFVGGSQITESVSALLSNAGAGNSPAAEDKSAFGGVSAAKVNEGQHYPMKGMPYPPMCFGAYVSRNAAPAPVPEASGASAASAAEGAQYAVARADQADPVYGGKLSSKELRSFKKNIDKRYKQAKAQLSEIEKARSIARGDERVELDVRALTVEKDLIDALAEGVFVANSSSDAALLKKCGKKLSVEIEAHNALVDDLKLISGVQLSYIPDSLYNDIISGAGYRRTPKIEYQVVEQPAVYYINSEADRAADGASIVETKGQPANVSVKGALSGRDLKSYVESSNTDYKKKSAELDGIRRSMKNAKGRDRVELDIDALKLEKELIDSLCENVTVASASAEKAYLKTSLKRLSSAVKEHNELVDDLCAEGGVNLTKVPESIGKDIVAGKGYSMTAKIEYRLVDVESVHPVVLADKSGEKSRGEVVEISGKQVSGGSLGMSKKMYSAYVSDNEKAYKLSGKTISSVKAQRKSASGNKLVELEVSELCERKESVDRLCENLAVAVDANDKSLVKTLKKRLAGEIKEHNALVDQLEADGGVKLTKVSDKLCEDILAGKGYRKTAKLEYTTVDSEYTQPVVIGGAVAADRAKLSEKSGAQVAVVGVMSGKILNNYIKNSNKTYLASKKNIEGCEKSNKGLAGGELVRAEINQLGEQRALIDSLCENVAAAGASANAAYLKTSKKRLSEEIKKHNKMVDKLKADGGVELSKISESLVEDAASGKGYRKTAKLELRSNQGEKVQQITSAGIVAAKPEKSGADMTKKELKSYKAQSDKSYKSAEKTISSINKSAKNKSGDALVESDIAKLNAVRERIDGLCADLVVARGAQDKSFLNATKKKLNSEIKSHNAMVDAFSKSNGTELSKLDASVVTDILEGRGYTKTPKLEYKVEGEENVHKPQKQAESAPDVRILNLRDGAISSPVLSGKELKKSVKANEKSYKSLSAEADKLAKSSKTATAGERIDLDIKELELRKDIIDGLCDTATVAQGSGDKKLLKTTKKRLEAEIKAHNKLVDDLSKNGGVSLTKAPETLYNDVVSGRGYRKMPRIDLEVAEYAPTQKLYYTESADNAEAAVKGSKKAAKKNNGKSSAEAMPVGPLSKKQLSKSVKANEKKRKAIGLQLDDLATKNKVAVGIEKHKLLVSSLNAQRSAVETEANTLALMCASEAGKKQIAKQKKKVEAELAGYNKLAAEYAEYTGDALTGADAAMAEKIVSGQPFARIRELEMSIVSSSYDYQYADYDAHDARRNEGKELAKAKSQAEAEKQNAINYEMATLKNIVKRQADKDNRTVAAAFMYAKGLIQCEDDSRSYSYGITKKVERKQSDNIVARCKKIDRNGKTALNAENEANKRYYEVVTTAPGSVVPVGKKRRWKLIPFFKKKYTTQDITYMRDEMMKLLNERDRINGQLISIYEGQVVDLGGKPLTFEIRKVKSDAAKKTYNSKAIKAMAKKVDKKIADSLDRANLYSYINDQIEAESNIAVIDFRLKHAKDDNLTPYEIKQLKYDRNAQVEAKARAAAQFKRTYSRSLTDNDAGGVWLAGLGLMLLFVAALVAVFMWFFGPNFSDNLKNIFGI